MVFGAKESEWDDVYSYVWVILGPLHFSIFVNDSPIILSRSTVMMYVDDTINDSTGSAQGGTGLTTLLAWIASNVPNLNLKKTLIMIMTSS